MTPASEGRERDPDRQRATTPGLIHISAIEQARQRVAPYVARTPLVATRSGLYLKAESLQITGAFKLRGAFNALLLLSPGDQAAGVIAASSGNHAQAVAYAASRLGIRATVVMPQNAPESKREGCRRWGAEVLIEGVNSAESMAFVTEAARRSGKIEIPAFDSFEIIAAGGAIGLEILEDAPDVREVWVPISGGGLISGIASAIKARQPEVRVIGVEPALANDAEQSFRAGRLLSISAEDAARTGADGLRVPMLGALTWPHVLALVDDVVSVGETEIADAARWIIAEGRLVTELSGATAAAGALQKADRTGVVAIVSGGNIDSISLSALLQERK